MFAHLIDSFRLMSGTLLDSKSDTRRPTGKLVFYINDEWALTDIGLESTKSDDHIRAETKSSTVNGSLLISLIRYTS